jgi:hypothetical protein
VDLVPGHPQHPVAGGGEELVTAAVVLECGRRLVSLPPVGFDDHPRLLPEEVDEKALAFDVKPDVAAGSR